RRRRSASTTRSPSLSARRRFPSSSASTRRPKPDNPRRTNTRGGAMLSVVFFLIGYAVIGLIAVPLAMRLIPPNPVYGVRTRRTIENPSLWYNVNAVGGQLLLVACG